MKACEKVGNGRKVAKHCVFPVVCGSGGSKSRLAKAAGAEPSGQMRDEKMHAVVARSTLRSQNAHSTTCGSTFGSCDVVKVHAVVARSTFRSQYVQNTPALDSGPHLKVEMSKKCTPLWREAHFEVKMYKTHHARTTFGSWDVEKVHAVAARGTFRSQNVRATFGGSDVLSRGRRKGLWTLSKVSKTWGFCSISKNGGRRETFEDLSGKMHFPWQAPYKRHVHQRC